MSRINVIAEQSWVLDRCAQELSQRNGWSINDPTTFPIELHIPYWLGLDRVRPHIRVGFFTHGFDRARKLARHFDAAVCMNTRMATVLKPSLLTQFFPEEDPLRGPVTIIRPGVDAPARMPVFGVCGRTYRDNRKGQHLVAKASQAGHEIISLGPGPWPCKSHSKDIDIPVTRRFFKTIDYLLVTSTDEGGPMPVLEAIAHHVPVIAPAAVGWCDEFPVIQYEAGSWESLESVLHRLTILPTWTEWAAQHQEFFDELESTIGESA